MKFNVAMLSFIVMLCIFLFGILRIRNQEQQKNVKLKRFHDIKLRVSNDMLGEYQDEMIKFTAQLKDTDEEIKAFETELIKLENINNQKKMDMDVCTGDKKEDNDKLASLESEMNLVNTAAESQKTSLAKDVTSLTQQMSQRSKVCDYIKTDSDSARKLCGLDVSKKEPAKPEAPKAEEAKPAAPKAEEAKPAAPKAEEAKPAAPKAEEAKPAAPKAEEAKPAAPKAEEAKPEAPKAEEAKPAAPKAEEAKPAAPKPEEVKPEAPKAEEAKPAGANRR